MFDFTARGTQRENKPKFNKWLVLIIIALTIFVCTNT